MKRGFDLVDFTDLQNGRSNKKSRKQAQELGINQEGVESFLNDLNESVTIRDNHIYFYGTVNKRNCLKLNLFIRDVNRKLTITENDLEVSNLKIYLHINSFGGSVFAALSSVDSIIGSKYPIVSIMEGGSASAATIMSVVCSERVIRPNAYMLIHQISSGFWGKMEEIVDEFKNTKKLMKRLKRIYKKHTKLNNKEDGNVNLSDILKRDLWLDSDECLKYGLVDKIEIV